MILYWSCFSTDINFDSVFLHTEIRQTKLSWSIWNFSTWLPVVPVKNIRKRNHVFLELGWIRQRPARSVKLPLDKWVQRAWSVTASCQRGIFGQNRCSTGMPRLLMVSNVNYLADAHQPHFCHSFCQNCSKSKEMGGIRSPERWLLKLSCIFLAGKKYFSCIQLRWFFFQLGWCC